MAMKLCEKHGIEFEPKALMVGQLKIGETNCPECEAEADREQARQDEERRAAADAAARAAFLRQANIEPVYDGATFDTFDAATEELQRAVSVMRRLVVGEVRQVVMIGKNGTGKTHLAVAAIQAMRSGLIMSMYEISTKIRETYTARATETELQVVDRLAREKLLVIDELGRTKGSDTEANWLSYIIDKRHVRNLPTVIISNKHVRKICPSSGCPDCLENYIGEDIMSRLSEGGVMLRFTGEDYRRRRPQ